MPKDPPTRRAAGPGAATVWPTALVGASAMLVIAALMWSVACAPEDDMKNAAVIEDYQKIMNMQSAARGDQMGRWREQLARGEPVLGLGVWVPAVASIQSVVVTTPEHELVASWTIWAPPLRDGDGEGVLSEPGWGMGRQFPIDYHQVADGLLVYWTGHSTSEPVVSIHPIADPGSVRGQFILIDLVEQGTWRVVPWVNGNQ